MRTNSSERLGDERSKQPSPPLFRRTLRKRILMALPDHFFLLSNVGYDEFRPMMECEVTEETCRAALWRLMVVRHLNGRIFWAFRDRESLQAEKDDRLKIA